MPASVAKIAIFPSGMNLVKSPTPLVELYWVNDKVIVMLSPAITFSGAYVTFMITHLSTGTKVFALALSPHQLSLATTLLAISSSALTNGDSSSPSLASNTELEIANLEFELLVPYT